MYMELVCHGCPFEDHRLSLFDAPCQLIYISPPPIMAICLTTQCYQLRVQIYTFQKAGPSFPLLHFSFRGSFSSDSGVCEKKKCNTGTNCKQQPLCASK